MSRSPHSGEVAAERIAADIETIAGFSESPAEVGYSRPTFSAPWREARDYVIAQAEAAGGEYVVDAAGNVHIRHRDIGWDRTVWLSGSHIDSVPSGGKYDGVMGVVVPLEVMRSRPELPLEIVIFAEEEGTTFGLGMLGSRAWTGVLDTGTLGTITNRHGATYLQAGVDHGVDETRLRSASSPGNASLRRIDAGTEDTGPAAEGAVPGDARASHHATSSAGRTDAVADPLWTNRIDPSRYVGFVEVHAEQGLGLWNSGGSVAAVNRINGRRQFEVTLSGQANHAGSTAMADRRDAAAGAAEIVVALEELGRRLAVELPFTVLTVGSLTVRPNAVNVIAGEVHLTVDFRSPEEALLERGEGELRESIESIAARRRLVSQINRSEMIAPSPLDDGICDALHGRAAAYGVEIPIVASGALHDAAVLAPHLPTAMVFVASRDGISHNPAEFSRTEDIALAARIVADTIAAHPDGASAHSGGKG